MEINRNNYEAYFLDYRENNLSPEQVAELMIFLEQNPDLKTSFEAYEKIDLKADNSIKFTSKQNLKKTEVVATANITQENYEEIMIDKYEGSLSNKNDEEFKTFLVTNPKLKLEYNLFRSTFLKPDETVVYSDKESLKKRGVILLYGTQIMYGLAVAASIIILLGVYFGFLKQDQSSTFENRDTFVLNKIEMVQPALEDHFVELPELELRNSSKIVKSTIIDNINETEKNDVVLATLSSIPTRTIEVPDKSTIKYHIIEPRNTEVFALNKTFVEENDDSKKSFFGRFIAGLTGRVINIEKPQKKSFFEYTVDGFNFLADQDVIVDKEVDENGKVVAYNINGNNINLSRSNKEKSTE